MFFHTFGKTFAFLIAIGISYIGVSLSTAQENDIKCDETLKISRDVLELLKEYQKLLSSDENEEDESQLARSRSSWEQTAQDLSSKLEKMTVSKTSSVKTVEKEAKKLYYDFSISYIDGAPDGVKARKLLAANGEFPGPMIVANLGDEVTIRVTNNIEEEEYSTTIHWHGIFQIGSQFQDGAEGVTQCGIPPGKTQIYNFKLEQTGTFWWHSHEVWQYTEGLFGPLIILNPDQNDPSDPYIGRYDPGDEIVLMLSEWNHLSAAEISKWYLSATSEGNEPLPESILINGRGRYPCDQVEPSSTLTCDPDLQTAWRFWVTRGKTYRIRVINSSGFTSYNFSIDGHKLEVIETDGNLVQSKSSEGEGPLVDVFSIAPGQRVSVLVTMNSEDVSEFAIRSVALTQYFPDAGPDIRTNPGAFIPETHAILQYEQSDTTQKNLRRKYQYPFQYFQNIEGQDDPITCSFQSSENPAISEVPASPNPTPNPPVDEESGPVVLLDESTLSSVNGPAPPGPPSDMLQVLLNIENNEDPEDIDRGFYLTFNGMSYYFDYKSKDDYDEFYTPLLTRVLNEQPIPPSAHPIYLPQLGQTIQIVVNNRDGGPHPLHLHGHRFWVLGQGKENDGDFVEDDDDFPLDLNGVTRDTAFVEASSWLVLRFVADNPGVWLFHCHIQWHAMGGLTVAFIEAEEELRERVEKIPEETKKICGYNGIELY